MTIPDSKRLCFSPMTADDAQLMYELDNDPAVMQYITAKVPTMEDIINTSIPRLLSYSNPAIGWGQWKVYLRQTGEFIGMVLVRPMNFFNDQRQDDDLELGWRFKQASWGHGYATEATRQVMAALAAQTPVKQFSAIARQENAASINIMKKIGMQYSKTALYKDPLGDMTVVFYQMAVNNR